MGLEVHDLEPPNKLLFGDRIKLERQRLGISRKDAAALMGVQDRLLAEWEAITDVQFASAITMLGHAGADILFIVTGRRGQVDDQGRTPQDGFRAALAMLPGDERYRLLLHLVTEELRWVTRGR